MVEAALCASGSRLVLPLHIVQSFAISRAECTEFCFVISWCRSDNLHSAFLERGTPETDEATRLLMRCLYRHVALPTDPAVHHV